MGWYGKVIGAVLGAIVGRGLFGAIVGLLIGHQFDRRAAGGGPQAGRGPNGTPQDLRFAFFECTFQAMGHVAKADGRVSEEEIAAAREAMRRFSLGEAERQRAIELFTAGKRSDFPLEQALGRLRRLAVAQPDLCRLFVQIQLEAALQGNGVNPASRAVLSRIAAALGVSPLEFASIEAMLRMRGAGTEGGAGGGAAGRASPSPTRLADAYEVLGIRPEAPDRDVTLAYRRLMSQNHPDKLVAQGLPESMVDAAHERTKRILEAYEIVKNHRGMK